MLIGNDKDFLASRVAYLLDLKGPAVVVQSACSSGLLAVHQAVQSLLSREIDMALAGAVSISMDIEEGYHADPGGPMSPTGKIAPFSAGANGTVGGNGSEFRLDIGVEGRTVYGAVSPEHRTPAMKVCVPECPNGASMCNRSPRGQRPRRLTSQFRHGDVRSGLDVSDQAASLPRPNGRP